MNTKFLITLLEENSSSPFSSYTEHTDQLKLNIVNVLRNGGISKNIQETNGIIFQKKN